MAKIPILKSQAQPSQPSTGRISPLTGPSQALQQVGQQIEKVAHHFDDLQRINQANQAVLRAGRRVEELKTEAISSPDTFDASTLRDRLLTIQNEASSEITNPRARDDFNGKYFSMAQEGEFAIRGILRDREIDLAKRTMLEGIDAMQNSSNREVQLKNLLQEYQNALIITPENAFKLEKATLKDWQESDIRDAIATDADSARDSILNGEFGELTADETAKWLEVIAQKIKKNDNLAKVQQEAKWTKNITDLYGRINEVSTTEIIEMMAQGDIDPQWGADVLEAKRDPNNIGGLYESDADVSMDLYKKLTDPEMTRLQFHRFLGEANKKKQITTKDATNAALYVNKVIDAAVGKGRPNAFSQALRTAIETFEAFAIAVAPSGIYGYNMVKELLERGIKNNYNAKEIEEATQDILHSTAKSLNPLVSQAGEKGTLMIDANGNRAVVYPDGRIEEVE